METCFHSVFFTIIVGRKTLLNWRWGDPDNHWHKTLIIRALKVRLCVTLLTDYLCSGYMDQAHSGPFRLPNFSRRQMPSGPDPQTSISAHRSFFSARKKRQLFISLQSHPPWLKALPPPPPCVKRLLLPSGCSCSCRTSPSPQGALRHHCMPHHEPQTADSACFCHFRPHPRHLVGQHQGWCLPSWRWWSSVQKMDANFISADWNSAS